MVGALLFSEKGVLIPVWLVLMRVLLLDPDVPLRTSIRRVAGEWRVWTLYAIPLAVYFRRLHDAGLHRPLACPRYERPLGVPVERVAPRVLARDPGRPRDPGPAMT
jgi:hypothetical protein